VPAIDHHPTVLKVREKLAAAGQNATRPKLTTAQLLQLCLDCGADDAGIISIDRPELDDQRDDILKYAPWTKSLLSFVCKMNREPIRSTARSLANLEFHHVGDHVNAVARNVVTRLEQSHCRAVNPAMGFPMEMDRFPGKIWVVSHKPVAVAAGLGTMGFGLPAAMGVETAHPDSLVIDIDGDGSILINIQELATLHCEELPVKVLLLNNQHLGMVVQWEDRFMESRRGHTYLGHKDDPEYTGEGSGSWEVSRETYPDFVQIAEGYGIKARHVRSRKEYPEALAEMLDWDGPYLLDVICPYQEHVLPMIPSGKTVQDMIIE